MIFQTKNTGEIFSGRGFYQCANALCAQDHTHFTAVFINRHALKVWLELARGGLLRPGSIPTETCRFTAMLTLRHHIIPFKTFSSKFADELVRKPHNNTIQAYRNQVGNFRRSTEKLMWNTASLDCGPGHSSPFKFEKNRNPRRTASFFYDNHPEIFNRNFPRTPCSISQRGDQ